MEAWILRLALIAAALAGYTWWIYDKGFDASEAKYTLKAAQATEAAHQKEADWQIDVQALIEVQNEEKHRIAADRDRLAASLRNRPVDRLPTTATCTSDGRGSTGAQLSEPDSQAFAGVASDADLVAADLRACQAWIRTVKARQEP